MTDFKNFINDFSHLISGMSSLTHNLKSEAQQNMRMAFETFMIEAGFVRQENFDVLSQRFNEAVEKINALETEIRSIKVQFNNTHPSEDNNGC